MAGIVVVAPLLGRLWHIEAGTGEGESLFAGVARWTASATAMSVAATLMTWPAVAFYFHQVSIVGIPATILALLALPAALAFAFLTAIGGLIADPVGWIAGWGAWLSLSYLVWIIEGMASLALTAIHIGGLSGYIVVAYYGVIVTAIWVAFRGRRLRYALSKRSLSISTPPWLHVSRFGVLSISLAVLSAVVWTAAIRQPQAMLEVTFLDVGHGDAILIRTPSQHTLLIDGGRDPQAIAEALGRLPFWDNDIDLVVSTHPHQDHLGGLVEVIQRFDVAAVLEPGTPYQSATYQAWRSAIERRGVPSTIAKAGQVVRMGDVLLEVLHPPERPLGGTSSDVDNNSIVLRVSYGQVSFLFTGDLQRVGEDYLVNRDIDLQSTVLKLGHHGSATSSTRAFLASVAPSVAIITTDEPLANIVAGNRESLDALARSVPEERLFISSDHGEVTFRSDGRRLWVETER